jgi:hypothetical protein
MTAYMDTVKDWCNGLGLGVMVYPFEQGVLMAWVLGIYGWDIDIDIDTMVDRV